MHSLTPSSKTNIRKNYGYTRMLSLSRSPLSNPYRIKILPARCYDISPPNATYPDTVTLINCPKTLDPIPVIKLPKPLTNSNHEHNATLRVAYQGVPGAYSETAAGKAYPNCEPIPYNQSKDAFRSVELHLTDRAILPIENSLAGSVHRTYDLLLRHRLHIVRELHLTFNHCLLALPGVRTHHIHRVISHPQALAQCEHTLTNLISLASRAAVGDTAGAAQHLAVNNLRDTAAIASSRAAEIYNLNILADRIEDDSNNVTRFVILAREPVIPVTGNRFKTSIVFGESKGTNNNNNNNNNNESKGTNNNNDDDNVLYKVLAAFAFRNIKVTKIESRPNLNRPVGRKKRFEYVYFVDFEASMADVKAQNAMNEVEEFTSFVRVLGSYPMDVVNVMNE